MIDHMYPQITHILEWLYPPAYSRLAPRGQLPYKPLYDDIINFPVIGNIVLLGDFTARAMQRETYALYAIEDWNLIHYLCHCTVLN